MKKQDVPIGLTYMRILLVPVVIVTFLWPFPYHAYLCAALFGLASLTDWLDGYLARYWHVTTPLGAFLDPVADKILTMVTLILLVGHYARPDLTLLSCVLIGREVIILALRDWMAQLGKRCQVNVSTLAKWKTGFFMTSIILLILGLSQGWSYQLGLVAMAVAAAMTLISMVIYIRASWSDLTGPTGYGRK